MIKEHAEFYELRTTVAIERGLHARPCVAIVELLTRYKNPVWVTKERRGVLDPEYVDGKSIMQMLMLAAHYDSDIRFLFARSPNAVTQEDVTLIAHDLESLLESN